MRVLITVPDELIHKIDEFVKGKYNNRSHFVAEACKEKMIREQE